MAPKSGANIFFAHNHVDHVITPKNHVVTPQNHVVTPKNHVVTPKKDRTI